MQEFEANIRPWTSEPSPATGCRIECTQEQNRVQREQEQRRNRERFSRELTESARPLLSLEQELSGQAGNFGEWLRTAHKTNEDFEIPFSKVVHGIYEAFQVVKHCYGTAAAQCLYDARSVVLPTEIKNAARYLSCSGRTEDISALAKSGFFMEELAHDAITQAIAHMEAGGAAAGAYQAAKDDAQPSDKAPRQQFQQTMGRGPPIFIWDFVAATVMNDLLDWFYGQVVGFLGDFFAQMGSMGVELFDLEWVQAVILRFSRLTWALFAASLVVGAFACSVEYASGRANLLQTALDVIKVFFANLKRGGILLIQIAAGSLYMFSVPRGYIDGFVQWIKQVIGPCLTARANIMSAVYTAQTAINTTRTIANAVMK